MRPAPSVQRLVVALPIHAQEVFRVVILKLQAALVGALQRLAETARQMDAGGRDEHAAVVRLDRDDALERMPVFLSFPVTVHKIENLVPVRIQEAPAQCHVTGRQTVAYPVAGGADLLVRLLGTREPL